LEKTNPLVSWPVAFVVATIQTFEPTVRPPAIVVPGAMAKAGPPVPIVTLPAADAVAAVKAATVPQSVTLVEVAA
jgi:hypothetical protein